MISSTFQSTLFTLQNVGWLVYSAIPVGGGGRRGGGLIHHLLLFLFTQLSATPQVAKTRNTGGGGGEFKGLEGDQGMLFGGHYECAGRWCRVYKEWQDIFSNLFLSIYNGFSKDQLIL